MTRFEGEIGDNSGTRMKIYLSLLAELADFDRLHNRLVIM